MRPLSKSKLMAYRQCPKRVWLEVHLALLDTPQPIFEAGFAAEGAMAFADVMLPMQENVQANSPAAWRMIEVKSSTAVKDYHREDVAVQAFVARTAKAKCLKPNIPLLGCPNP